MFSVNHLCSGTKFFSLKSTLLRWIGWKIGDNVKVVGPIDCSGRLVVGNNSWIGKNLKIYGNGIVNIGSNCDLGPNVTFLTGGHSIGDKYRRAGKGETYSITVRDGTWIGANTTLCGNIDIGESSVVAACACVNKSVMSNTLVGGVPARIIKELD